VDKTDRHPPDKTLKKAYRARVYLTLTDLLVFKISVDLVHQEIPAMPDLTKKAADGHTTPAAVPVCVRC